MPKFLRDNVRVRSSPQASRGRNDPPEPESITVEEKTFGKHQICEEEDPGCRAQCRAQQSREVPLQDLGEESLRCRGIR